MEPVYPTEKDCNKMGGNGAIYTQPLLKDEALGKNVRLFAKVTLPPGCSLGDHTHHGEREVYTVLSGNGLYHDDDRIYEIKAGDTLLCTDGHSHGVENHTEAPLIWLAAIILD